MLDLDPQVMLNEIEEVLHQSVNDRRETSLQQYSSMLEYHLGWEGEGAGVKTRGKRVRPLLVLLSCAAAGGNWRNALPAAAAVELVHNFSLIHDDIQDNSPIRRGRETVWKRWGIAQAINIGDAMLTLAHLALLRLDKDCSPKITVQAARSLQMACLQLTKGQYLDLHYESQNILTEDEYWQMVAGKTASLLSACTELGAIVADTTLTRRQAFRDFGFYLGLAFQAQDDILGIWGDAALTGKSTESDLSTKKKSLPVIYGLNQKGDFALQWLKGPIEPEQVQILADQLEREGARSYTQEAANHMTAKALTALEKSEPHGKARQELTNLAQSLLGREE